MVEQTFRHSSDTSFKQNPNLPAGDDSRFQVRLDDGIWYDMNTSGSGSFTTLRNVETGNGIHQVYFRGCCRLFNYQIEVLLLGIPHLFLLMMVTTRWNVFSSAELWKIPSFFIFFFFLIIMANCLSQTLETVQVGTVL
jgi:hypothetical protein